ncbi:hypothetical protein HMPREF1992_01042 [Selenomonas sp. oral taxon 892 str. F0426]|nr:hypothetical protein HMPREF1992_01042 [Selenomonas sp. oral taxon 892 str. F0426]
MSALCHPIPSLHHVVNKSLGQSFFADRCYYKLIEQERNLMPVDFLHCPPIGGLQPLVVAQ